MKGRTSLKRISSHGTLAFSLVLLFLLMGVVFNSRAQQLDSLKHTISDSTSIKLREKLSAKDSVKNSIKAKQDSVRKVSSSVSERINNLQNKFSSRADSVKGKG